VVKGSGQFERKKRLKNVKFLRRLLFAKKWYALFLAFRVRRVFILKILVGDSQGFLFYDFCLVLVFYLVEV